jgi:hypothetical protein
LQAASTTSRGTALFYAGTMLLSAILLFLVQPMFGRLVLPRLGGTAAVWVTVMLFFQGALLAGYAYAHLLSRHLPLLPQVLVHLIFCAAALAFLPVSLPAGWQPPADRAPQFDLILMMARTIGPPFVVLSATAPLLQRWYSLTTARDAGDPYHLYAASNLGSLGALLGYPTLVEPNLGLTRQGEVWALALLLLFGGILLCGLVAFRRRRPEAPAVAVGGVEAATGWRLRLRWIALAAAPSSLFLALTTQISTDIAAVPLLWILPLTLYLLTFVIAFARRPVIGRAAVARAIPYVATIAVLVAGFETGIGLPQIGIGAAILFLLALMCHSELAASRPAPGHLTEFYLLMSLGGALGGAFNAIAAPLLFDGVYEYPLALLLALALWAVGQAPESRDWRSLRWWGLALALAVGLRAALDAASAAGHLQLMVALKALAAVGCFAVRRRPAALVMIAAAILAASVNVTLRPELGRYRSFFGVHRIETNAEDTMHFLVHGNTDHGAQFIDSARRRMPLTYYGREGPAGQALAALRANGPVSPAGVIGLGAGAMACLTAPGEAWTFFEIDPAIAATARDPRYFSYLADCAPTATVTLGDGRIGVAAQPDGRYRLLVVDAFGSDAIPVHLLTREAMDLYFRKLAPGGLLLVHFSNRNADLLPVLARLAADRGLAARWQFHVPADTPAEAGQTPSQWAVFARTDADLLSLASDARWLRLPDAAGRRVWTDDYVDILSVLRRPQW